MDAVKKIERPVRRSDVRAWAKVLDDFLAETKEPPEKLEKLMGWYCRHIGEEFIPQAYSGDGFCRKYAAISDARERYEDANGVDEEDKPPSPPMKVRRMARGEWEAMREADHFQDRWDLSPEELAELKAKTGLATRDQLHEFCYTIPKWDVKGWLAGKYGK